MKLYKEIVVSWQDASQTYPVTGKDFATFDKDVVYDQQDAGGLSASTPCDYGSGQCWNKIDVKIQYEIVAMGYGQQARG